MTVGIVSKGRKETISALVPLLLCCEKYYFLVCSGCLSRSPVFFSAVLFFFLHNNDVTNLFFFLLYYYYCLLLLARYSCFCWCGFKTFFSLALHYTLQFYFSVDLHITPLALTLDVTLHNSIHLLPPVRTDVFFKDRLLPDLVTETLSVELDPFLPCQFTSLRSLLTFLLPFFDRFVFNGTNSSRLRWSFTVVSLLVFVFIRAVYLILMFLRRLPEPLFTFHRDTFDKINIVLTRPLDEGRIFNFFFIILFFRQMQYDK